MLVVVIRTMASPGASIFGTGTSSTATRYGPAYLTAFMAPPRSVTVVCTDRRPASLPLTTRRGGAGWLRAALWLVSAKHSGLGTFGRWPSGPFALVDAGH